MSGELLAQRHFKAADDICRFGLSAVPDSRKLIIHLANSLAMQGRREEAIAEIDKGLLLYPGDLVLEWNRKQFESTAELRMRFLDHRDRLHDVA